MDLAPSWTVQTKSVARRKASMLTDSLLNPHVPVYDTTVLVTNWTATVVTGFTSLRFNKEAVMISGEGRMAEVWTSLLARKFNNEGIMESRLIWMSSMSQPANDALIRRSDDSVATHHVSMLYGRTVARFKGEPHPRCNDNMTYCIENNLVLSTSNSGVPVSVQLSHIGTGYSVCCNASISRIDDYPIKHHFDPTVAHIQLFPSHSATSGLAPVLNSGLAPSHPLSKDAYAVHRWSSKWFPDGFKPLKTS